MNENSTLANPLADPNSALLARAAELKESVMDAARIVAVSGVTGAKDHVMSAAKWEMELAASELRLNELQTDMSRQQEIFSELRQIVQAYESLPDREETPTIVWDPAWLVLVGSAFVAAAGLAGAILGL